MQFTIFANLLLTLTGMTMITIVAGDPRGAKRNKNLPSEGANASTKRRLMGSKAGGLNPASASSSTSCNSGYKLAEILLEVDDAIAAGAAFTLIGDLILTDIFTGDVVWLASSTRTITLTSGVIDSGTYEFIDDGICLLENRCYTVSGTIVAVGGPPLGVSFNFKFKVQWGGETAIDMDQTVIPPVAVAGVFASVGEFCNP